MVAFKINLLLGLFSEGPYTKSEKDYSNPEFFFFFSHTTVQVHLACVKKRICDVNGGWPITLGHGPMAIFMRPSIWVYFNIPFNSLFPKLQWTHKFLPTNQWAKSLSSISPLWRAKRASPSPNQNHFLEYYFIYCCQMMCNSPKYYSVLMGEEKKKMISHVR